MLTTYLSYFHSQLIDQTCGLQLSWATTTDKSQEACEQKFPVTQNHRGEREGNANIWERYSPWSSQHIPLYRKGVLGSDFPETPVWILQAESTGELYRDGFFSCNPFSPPQATLPLKHFPLS